MEGIVADRIDARVYALYDDYCHGRLDRRQFLARSAAIVVGGASAQWMAEALLPRYVQAQTISLTDPRIKALYVTYPSPGGNSGEMRGYLAQPAGEGPFPAVAVINSARHLKVHASSNGSLGAMGFCWGGGMTSRLAVALGAEFKAGVSFYGASVPADDVARIKAAMMIILADTDPRINAMWPDYKAALEANGVTHTMHTYEGTLHGFHNNSTPRYNQLAADLAWNRTVGFLRQHLGT